MKKFFYIYLIIMCLGYSCSGDGGLGNLDDEPETEQSKLNTKIYDKMSTVYFWRDSLETKSSTNLEVSTQKYFDEKVRYRVNKSVPYALDTYGDRFSYIIENEGVSSAKLNNRSSMASATDPVYDWGFEFLMWTTKENEVLFLQVLYVVPNSPANTAGIKRGDFINSINNQKLTLSNAYTLLSGNKVTLSLVDSEYNKLKDVELTKTTFNNTPLIYSDIIEGSNPKTGYFFFSEFTDAESDMTELKEMFAEFKAAGVENVIVDLRYNPGGYITTSQLISSALTPNQSDLNSTVMFQIQSNASSNLKSSYKYYSAEEIGGIANHVAPKKLAFIMTGFTASASELTYNSLNTLYADSDCIFVGETTVGKNLGSNSYEVENWTMHPITGRIYNKDGVSGYEQGFTPDIEVLDLDPEDIDVKDIGDTNERMLSAALAELGVNVNGVRASYQPSPKTKAQALYELKPVFSARVEYPAVILDNLK